MTEKDIDVDAQLDAVQRSLEIERRDGLVATVATISQSYPTTVEDLWEACTTAERLARWFGEVTGELELGGRYEVVGNASGTIESCAPPHSFSASWEFAGAVTRVTVRIDAEGESSARLSLEHAGDIPEELWAQFGPAAGGVGWDLAFVGMAHALATGGSAPLETTSWAESEDAKRFIAEASRRWAETDIAAGTPEAEARTAGERASSFYLGG